MVKAFFVRKRLFTLVVAALVVFTMMPVNLSAVYATTGSEFPKMVEDGALDGVKVRFRPAGSHKPLSINQDGSGSQNCVHLYYNGRSSQFCLVDTKENDNSYYIFFYQDYKNKDYKSKDDCVLDVERTKNDESYLKEGQVIHVTGYSDSDNAKNKRWKLIQGLCKDL